ncbi:MAG: hypothetical protein E7238_00410 [Sarcina sp.]|nr:hypothetical protein [Sarcina sp.]
MKLYIENEGENFEMEAKAAYVVMIDPADRDADVALMVMGQTSHMAIVSGIAKTLDSFFQTLTKGNSATQQVLWKLFKKAYKTARITGHAETERNEPRPVREED